MPLHDKCEQADNRALSLLTIEDSVNSESAVTLLGTETGTMAAAVKLVLCRENTWFCINSPMPDSCIIFQLSPL